MAQVTYECKTEKGYPFRITAELVRSRDDDYGNKHYIWITEESGYEYNLDARYDARFNTEQKFYDNILDVLLERYSIAEYKLTDKQ